MEFLRNFEEVEEIRVARNVIRDRSNPMEHMEDVRFYEKFRFSKDGVIFIIGRIENALNVISNRGIPVPMVLQVLGTLRFYASGSFQEVVGELLSLSQPTMSRIIRRVSAAIASQQQEFIAFPVRQESAQVQRKFSDIGGIPGVIGTIDCTHIKIQSPGGPAAEMYRNRKGYFSINTQAVCNSDLQFTNIIARWPGSVHDSRIFNSSRLCGQFENGILLGDAGYALKPYLMTPVSNPQNPAERRYNYCHCKTRNTVERLFGIWKRRFPCLSKGLRVKKQTTVVIIVATAVLHNIARKFNLQEFNHDDDDDDDDDDVNAVPPNQRLVNRLGVAVRNTIIHQHFTR